MLVLTLQHAQYYCLYPLHIIMDESPPKFELNGWTFAYTSTTISNSQQIDAFEASSHIHCPEMPYLSNTLTATHSATGVSMQFNASDALMRCQQIYHLQEGSTTTTSDNLPVPAVVQVNASDKWSTKHLQQTIAQTNGPLNNINIDDIGVVKLPYDWTYTTDYTGTCSTAMSTTEQPINVALLQQREPILWFAAVPLYDDELHDNGISTLNVKCRVMPSCWLILQTYFLRVDQVVVRVYETRVFHQFGTNSVVREHTRYECTWDDLPNHRLPTEAGMLTEPQLLTRKLPPTFNIKHSIQLTNT